jgi:DNA-binding MarR family transcriptional regulator
VSDVAALATTLISEILNVEQRLTAQISRVLPSGMEMSHFSVLNYLVRAQGEKTPAQLAAALHVTRGAMTNTLSKLEIAGHIHIRPDWDDARRKWVALSPAGKSAYDAAIGGILPFVEALTADLGEAKIRAALPILRELRLNLDES